MKDIYQQSVDMHRVHGGKIALQNKIAIENKDDLSLAYSPGVAGASRAIDANPAEVKQLTLSFLTAVRFWGWGIWVRTRQFP